MLTLAGKVILQVSPLMVKSPDMLWLFPNESAATDLPRNHKVAVLEGIIKEISEFRVPNQFSLVSASIISVLVRLLISTVNAARAMLPFATSILPSETEILRMRTAHQFASCQPNLVAVASV